MVFAGATGLSIGGRGGGVDRAPWLEPPPPQKGSIDGTPQNPTETDPQALEVPQTQKSAKKWKWDFWNQRVEGSEKSSFAIYSVKKNCQFLMLKKIFGAFSASAYNN